MVKKERSVSLFSSCDTQFSQKIMTLYGKPEKVCFLCLDLLWRPAERLCRFVLVKIDKVPFVLMSSDLTLTPEEIIALYANRFKIETGIDDQKNDIGGYAYHFWTNALPKRKRNSDAVPPTNHKILKKIAKAKQATEAFVCLSVIATGILTIIALAQSCDIWNRYPGYLRTIRNHIPTISTAKFALS